MFRYNSINQNSVWFIAFLLICVLTGCNSEPVKSPDNKQTNLLLHVPSPDWRDQIIYLALTDRFNDGDPSNNDQGAGEYDPSQEHFYSGGDIKGLTQKLDYIQGLGATAVWTTPLIQNQWRVEGRDYTGYTGYFGTDFSRIDAHNGTLLDYQQLSDKIHRKGMYLIQDIVVNHTGFLFEYDGPYNALDTSENFKLLNSKATQPPPQYPFDMTNRHNPEHVKTAAYNWTPVIHDYQNLGENQYTHQLGGLADINTKNPLVVDTFKKTYGDWIRSVGVDAFRIDTVRYVEPEFFDHFLNDNDGILNTARETGRDNFLSFGEVLEYSKPYQNDGEKRVAKYVQSDSQTGLTSAISFPLKAELKSVFAQGKPTEHLAYRLHQHMEVYPNPHLSPVFIDNHDVERFLASGDQAGFKQALATIFTIPGIPVIYQGSAQGLTESRQAMFKGGYKSDRDHFDQTTTLYRFISSLAELRKTNKVLSRGDFKLLAANKHSAGLLAYRRSYQGRNLDVIFNTSNQAILVDNLSLPASGTSKMKVLFAQHFQGQLTTTDGLLTAVLPARSIVVFEKADATQSEVASQGPAIIQNSEQLSIMDKDFIIRGTTDKPNSHVLLVKDGAIDTAINLTSDKHSQWEYDYQLKNYGKESLHFVAYDVDQNLASDRISIQTQLSKKAFDIAMSDPVDEPKGMTGNIRDMQQQSADGQKDIVKVQAYGGGDVLNIVLQMNNLTTDWLPPNGFDNVAFSIFFDLPNQQGIHALPQLNTAMPDNHNWDLGHVAYGWGNTLFTSENASAEHAGKRLGTTPVISTNKENRTVSFAYNGSDYGVESWRGAAVYITTWDITGEGSYVLLKPEPSHWAFSGGNSDDPKVFDQILLHVE